jgi:membrane protease YdiL (CAAX protease family)
MNALQVALRREFRVAFSRRAQPLWFRFLKWVGLLTAVALWHERPGFWPALAGLTVAALVMHCFYRWKTRTWTRPWGGWNDLPAGRD